MGRQASAHKPRRFLFVSGLLIGTLFLTNCGGGGGATLPSRQLIVPKTELVNVKTGHISITPPPGFCKDARSSKNSEASAFLLFANCGYLNSNGRHASQNATFSGLVTTSIAKKPILQNDSSLEVISDFLSSAEGLSSLSASGKAETVSIMDKRQASDGVYLQLRDTNAALSSNVWKSFLIRSDHLITVTLLQNEKSDITPEQTMQFLQSYSETITLKSEIVTAQPVKPLQANQVPRTTPSPAGQQNKLKKVGILRRLLL